jgi:endonuclease G, mitochondrial
MLINTGLISGSERRFRKASFSPDALNNQLGDGKPLAMSTQKAEERARQLLIQTGNPQKAEIGLERIINGNDIDSINTLLKGMRASHPVCRIEIKDSEANLVGYASGFLIGPGVLMTNHHVLGSAAEAKNSIADFDYELDIDGMERRPAYFALEPARLFYTNERLDYTIVAVAPASLDTGHALSDWGWLPLSGERGKGDPGEYLTIIQHPGGQTKQICVRENKLLKYFDDFVWYLTDTTAGSSGSPAFNRFWQVIALHHSGVPKKDSQGRTLTKDGKVADATTDESMIDWIANEGVRVSSMVADLKTSTVASHPLVQPVLAGLAPAPVVAIAEKTPISGVGRSVGSDVWVEQVGDTASLVVPIRVPISLVRTQIPNAAAPALSPPSPPPILSGPAAIGPGELPLEAVHIDQTTLGSRPGYQPNFIGSGKLAVPLPKIPASLRSKIATLTGKAKQSELKYFNYSVVMNKARKLAFFSCVNIDASEQQDVGKREGDTWFPDPRIDAKFQINNTFYGKQSTFEAARTTNPFDRGHLVRRLDATWGATVAEAKEHGDDSFHFTNCSPQFWTFNQSQNLWAGLENYTRDTLLRNQDKGVVMNGPIFDGPDAEGDKLPDPSAPSRKDPLFGGVAIPKYFWKVLVTKDGSSLKALAFICSQRNLIVGIDRIHQDGALFEKLSAARVRVFQTPLKTVAKLTGLNFGPLVGVDVQEAAMVGPRLIESLSDIRA